MFTIRLVRVKQTKNKVVYADQTFGALYVPNDVVDQLGRPDQIDLTITPAAAAVELRAA